ncbi:MAG: hypothetical protein Q9195_001980 [Heterodermia aff. obscurata]
METTKVFFSTLFAFSDAAKEQLTEQYEKTRLDRVILQENAITTQFTLQFRSDDKEGLTAFIQVLNRFTTKAGDNAKPEKVSLVIPISPMWTNRVTRLQDNFLRLKGTSSVVDDLRSNLDEPPMDSQEAAIDLIEDKSKNWDGSLDTNVAKRIGSLTGCSVSQRLDGPGLLVKGTNFIDIERAIAKLNVLSSMMHQRSLAPVIHNFPVTEGEINISLQMVALRELCDRRLTTTLVSSDLVKRLPNQLIVVMNKSGQIYPDFSNFKAARSFEIESILWKDVPYASIGRKAFSLHADSLSDKEEPAVAITATVAEGSYRTLADWIESSAAAGPIATDPFMPIPSKHSDQEQEFSNKGSVSDVIEQNLGTKISPRKRPTKGRKAKGGVVDAVSQPAESLADSDKLESVKEESSQISKASEKIFTMHATTVPIIGTELETASVTNSSGPRNTYAQELAQLQFPDAPSIQPPYMPAMSTTSGYTSVSSSQPAWARARVAGNEGNLISLNPPTTSNETKAKNSNSQDLRFTMKQRKAPPTNGPFPGETSVLKQYDDGAAQLLSMARTIQGQIKLEVIIGRLMIDHQSGSSEFKKRTFAVGQWPTVFLNASAPARPRSFITNRLTSFGSDADFISQLKLPSGRSMFTPEPCERAAFYRFKCFSTLNAHSTMVVDIYEDQTLKLQSTDLLNGALDLHFAKRYWDARIAVTTNQSVDDERYAKAAQFMADSLCVVPTASNLDIFTKTKSKTINFQTIEIRRETRHRSTNYPDLLLKLSEVQELSFEISATENEEQCYHAWTKPKPDMVNDGKLWWEVSLASVTAEQILQENETLELGEMSIWKPSDIVDALIVRHMSHLARDIVTRIDSVGNHNRGPKTGTSKEASEQAIANLGFW